MSTLRVDTITDEAGTGAPNFPNGVTGVASTPASTVIYVAQNTAPTGYLKANGAAISRTTYADLFAAIGTAFGTGDGSTTFNVPDLRGEFIRAWDDARGVDSGRSFGSAQADAFQGHKHQSQTGNYSIAGGQYTIGQTAYSTSTSFVLNPISDGVNGTPRTSSETRPRNIALLACIKY